MIAILVTAVVSIFSGWIGYVIGRWRGYLAAREFEGYSKREGVLDIPYNWKG